MLERHFIEYALELPSGEVGFGTYVMGHTRTSRLRGLHFRCDAEHTIECVHEQNPNESDVRK